MKLDYLIRGAPGHPVHPPLTDATIGVYTFATIAAVLSALGIAEESAAKGWALALVVGLVLSGPTSITGVIDWLKIAPGTPLKRTATSHLIAMVSATVLFLITALVGYGDGMDGVVGSGALVLNLIAFGLLTLGGWLGGAIVFTYGMRVLDLVEEPAHRAVSPIPHREEAEAEK
ncbi:MAG: DUF2231 domain-containing protein [Gaiellaceae bacterium MAG52_C11]|nr:DUF2231 domain-containing protein [Candidatus Gaiellasilicea maunaloa]